MALPQLNTTPRYQVKIPSTGKTVRFRPFLVKEQKVLLIAYESQDKVAIIQAMLDTLDSCTEGISAAKLSTFDADYLFTQIRAKSVGEVVDLNIQCTECETHNEVKVNLEDIKMKVPKKDMDVQLTDQITMKMKYPDYNYFLKNPKILGNDSMAESLVDIVIACIESVKTDDEIINISDEPREEVIRFIESLTANQFEKVASFVQDIPKMEHTLKFKCINCEHENERHLEGLEDFF